MWSKGLRLLAVAATTAFLTAAAGARMAAPPGDAPQLNTAEINPPAPVPREGLICVWAIYANFLEIGRRCGVTPNPAFQTALEGSVARMEAYARRQFPARAAEMAAWRQREIIRDARLCDADSVGSYNDFAQLDPARVRGDVDEMLARSPPVDWGNQCA